MQNRVVLQSTEMVSGKDWRILDKGSQRFGFRSVKLVQEPLEEPDMHGKGTTFLFEINNVRMFMGGKFYPNLRNRTY